MNNEEVVKKWLKKCEENEVLPWEYDFKQEVFGQKSWHPSFHDNPVKRILEKDRGDYGTPICETEDSMLAQAVYYIIWGTYSKNVIGIEKGKCDADVMNSFWTIFRNFMNSHYREFFKEAKVIYPRSFFPNKGSFSNEDEKARQLLRAYKQYNVTAEDTWVSVILRNYDMEFKKLDTEELQNYAKLSHTIGNFTLVPKGFNYTGTDEKKLKHNDLNNTWSEALHNLKELDWQAGCYLECSSWDEYFNTFFMRGYEEAYSYEMCSNFQVKFLKKLNTEIECRGKLIIKELCDKLELQDMSFYKEYGLKDIKK